MSVKQILKFMFQLTCIITTVLLLLYSLIFRIHYLTSGTRWTYPVMLYYQYPLMALISVLPTVVFIGGDRVAKRNWNIRIGIHFVLTSIFTIYANIYFFWGWYGWRGLFTGAFFYSFLPVFSLIYFGALFVYNRQQKKLGDELNERIKTFHDE